LTKERSTAFIKTFLHTYVDRPKDQCFDRLAMGNVQVQIVHGLYTATLTYKCAEADGEH